MKNSLVKIGSWVLVLLVGGCVDPYRPPEISDPNTYLVVNGFFDSAPGATTTIQLSWSQNLTDSKPPTAETNARLTIESAHNATYSLTEKSAGVYSLSGVTAQPGETYRLHIQTASGLTYYSDYVPVTMSPAIDSVSWQVENDGVQINVNTHDPQNTTHYYRWEYDETWEYTAAYYSLFVYNDTTRTIDRRNEAVFNCWGSSNSRNIRVNSTVRLSQDIVSQFPLIAIPGSSIKFQSKYSILVRQYALSQAGYEYYDQLAKITQNIGSIFDPQPSQITGNIHSTNDPTNLALGFFWAGSVTSQRIFIRKSQLPGWVTITGDGYCETDTLTAEQIRDSPTGIVSEYIPSPPPPSAIRLPDGSLSLHRLSVEGGSYPKTGFLEMIA